jgi:hypothetical protein
MVGNAARLADQSEVPGAERLLLSEIVSGVEGLPNVAGDNVMIEKDRMGVGTVDKTRGRLTGKIIGVLRCSGVAALAGFLRPAGARGTIV